MALDRYGNPVITEHWQDVPDELYENERVCVLDGTYNPNEITKVEKPELKVISLWAGPGAGKSTLAASLFARMKRLRYKVELVTEVAKDLTYEKSWKRLSNQLQVLSKQNFRLERLRGETEWAITDSPLPLSLIYAEESDLEWLEPLVWQLWQHYNNFPFQLMRTSSPYEQFGRNKTLEEAKELDYWIGDLATSFGVIAAVNPDEMGVEDKIISIINHRSRK